MKAVLQYLRLLVITLALSIINGMLLLTVVHILPVERIDENIRKSSSIFVTEGDYYDYSPENLSSRIDNFTDSIMLMIAGYKGSESIINQAIYNYFVLLPDKPKTESLVIVGEDKKNNEIEKRTYEWYWHGYLVFLKPLLFFFSILEIRHMNYVIILGEIVIISILFYRQRKGLYILPYIISVTFMNPSTISLSLAYCVPFHITNISIIILLLHPKYVVRRGAVFFCLIGALTSYMDFLTYPILTLIFPFVLYVCISDRINLSKCMGCLVSWATGYFGMWASKWLISTIITGENHFVKGFERITVRSSNTFNRITIGFSDFTRIMKPYVIQGPYLILLILLLVFLIVLIFKQKHVEHNQVYKTITIVLISLLPFIWYLISIQHSFLHNHITYRTIAGAFFALGCCLIPLIGDKTTKN